MIYLDQMVLFFFSMYVTMPFVMCMLFDDMNISDVRKYFTDSWYAMLINTVYLVARLSL